MELDIEVKWTQEDIEKLLRLRLEEEGLLLIPQPKPEKKKGKTGDVASPDKYFVWPRGGEVKVKVRAMLSPRAQMAAKKVPGPEHVDPESNDVNLDTSMLPHGTDTDALERAARQRRPLMEGESRTPPEPSKVGR